MKIIINPEQVIPAVDIEIPEDYTYFFIDDPGAQTVSFTIKEIGYTFVLWSGADYISAGDYTNEQLNQAISEYILNISV